MNLDQTINEAIQKVAKKHGLHHDFEVVISSDESLAVFQGHLVDVRLEAGNPPKMIIPMIFIARCFLMDKKLPMVFNDRIHRALEKYPRMIRTLSHNIPHDRALILRSDMKKWIKTRGVTDTGLPEFSDNEFEIDYIAIVKDKVTGHSFSQTDKDPIKAKNTAKRRLTKIFMADERMMIFRDMVLGIQEQAKIDIPKQEPKIVHITTQVILDKESGEVQTEQVNERMEY